MSFINYFNESSPLNKIVDPNNVVLSIMQSHFAIITFFVVFVVLVIETGNFMIIECNNDNNRRRRNYVKQEYKTAICSISNIVAYVVSCILSWIFLQVIVKIPTLQDKLQEINSMPKIEENMNDIKNVYYLLFYSTLTVFFLSMAHMLSWRSIQMYFGVVINQLDMWLCALDKTI